MGLGIKSVRVSTSLDMDGVVVTPAILSPSIPSEVEGRTYVETTNAR
jgi:hypothetical protein